MLGLPRTIAFVTALALCAGHFGHDQQDQLRPGQCGPHLKIRKLLKCWASKAAGSDTIAWIIGIVMTSIGGLMPTPIYYVNNTVGAPFRTVSLMAVVLGGLGDIRGAFICGLLLGVVESVLAAYFTANIGLLGIFVVYLVVFLFKPQGIFGRKERVG